VQVRAIETAIAHVVCCNTWIAIDTTVPHVVEWGWVSDDELAAAEPMIRLVRSRAITQVAAVILITGKTKRLFMTHLLR
jgi:hypothetical protein